ncbi:hypothetical protein [Marivita sp.]|uniref:hypothetical protein n=1 Tax=Marivita sp. TaxID=2003365 RepID=UPI003B594A60
MSNKQRRRWQPKQVGDMPLSEEAATQQFVSYMRAVKLIGPIDKRNRRIVELAQIEQKLRDGEHVQNRTLQTWLTAEEYAEIDFPPNGSKPPASSRSASANLF